MNPQQKVFYKIDGNAFYKVNETLERITKVENNQVERPDFATNIERIKSLKNVRMEKWKEVENAFFLSQDFSWVYEGSLYRTTSQLIDYRTDKLVFHNGKVWEPFYNANYYPRIQLRRFYVLNGEKKEDWKWTKAKYLRHFAKIPRYERIENFLLNHCEL